MKKDQNGFTLIELLIVLAVFPTLALGIAHMLTDARRAQVGLQTDAEWEQQLTHLTQVIRDPAGCTETLQDKVFDPTQLSTAFIDSIVIHMHDQPGQILAQTGMAWPQQSTVESVRLEQFNFVATDRYAAKIVIRLRKAAGTFVGTATKTREFPIRIHTELLSANQARISSCTHAFEEVTELQCHSLQGNWDENRTPQCRIPKLLEFDNESWTPLLNNYDAPVTMASVPNRVIRGYGTTFHNGHKDNQIRFLLAQPRDGNLELSTSQCTWLPSTNPSTWVNDFDADVNFTCPGDTFMTNEHSYHSNTYEDRRYRYQCCQLQKPDTTFVQKKNCEWSGLQNVFRWPVDFRCEDGKTLTGVKSTHNNSHEDRMYRFQCCGID